MKTVCSMLNKLLTINPECEYAFKCVLLCVDVGTIQRATMWMLLEIIKGT